MSYLSASGNVGYSSLSQISDASCATQYKMGVDGSAPSTCEDDDLSYFPHVNEQLFSSKYKVNSTELFTFQDTDGVAGEITVCDESDVKAIASPTHVSSGLTNGFIQDMTPTYLTNGHVSRSKVRKTPTSRSPSRSHSLSRTNSISEILASVGPDSPSGLAIGSPKSLAIGRNSISKETISPFSSTSNNQSFLDVFKREMGSFPKKATNKDISVAPVIKTEVKATVKKTPSQKATSSQGSRKAGTESGRGPALHEALQRIPPAATPSTSRKRHAPRSRPCDSTTSDSKYATQLSSDEETNLPSFGTWMLDSAEDESGGMGTRGARLAARGAALRRQAAAAAAALRLAPTHAGAATLARTVKTQLSAAGVSGRLPPAVLEQLLAARGMTSLLSARERRNLRSAGWSGGWRPDALRECAAPACARRCLPRAPHCLAHVTQAPGQRLYAACAALFADGRRCTRPVLRLGQAPLCDEHAWKRDNYDKLSREVKPRKAPPPRKRHVSANSARRTKRRRRPPPTNALAHAHASPFTQEVSVCSNSSAHDSSEDTGVGGLSDTEFMAGDPSTLDVSVTPHELEAAHTPDDILDSSVLHQIPDEAFTEFFNQAEGGEVPSFGEAGGELARALEAVLDERALDSLADCVFTEPAAAAAHHHTPLLDSTVELSSVNS